MTRISVLAMFGLLVLAGCATQNVPLEESSSPTSPAETVVPPAEDDMAACAIVSDTLTPVSEIMTDLVADGGTTLDPVEVSAQADLLRDMLEVSTARMDAYAAPYASVILLVDDIFEGRADGGSQTMNTGAYRDGAIGLLTYCVDTVGYRAP